MCYLFSLGLPLEFQDDLFRISHDTFSNLPELSELDLSGNSVSKQKHRCKILKQLLQINAVDDFAFSQLPMLTSLDLSSNRLESLPSNVIYDSLMQKKTSPVQRKLSIQSKRNSKQKKKEQ